jgi:RNA polymerase sigma-70 factor (ECF subfamily)
MSRQTDTDAVDWEAVYREQVPRLYNFFRYRTGDGGIAQELTSRTMMRAWRYRQSYRADLGAFGAWLFQIARRVAIDYLRERSNAPLPLYEATHQSDDASLETEVQQRRDAEKLYHLLATLPQRDQEIISLKYGAEMTNRDIARVLDISESNVGTILHRTLKKLRIQWDMSYETR